MFFCMENSSLLQTNTRVKYMKFQCREFYLAVKFRLRIKLLLYFRKGILRLLICNFKVQ